MGGASDPWPAYDAIVIGGGPAGATVGRLLSTWGHRVLIVTDDHGDTAPLAVSLPPSCVDLLRRLEVGEVLSRSGFQETTGNTAWWGDERTVAPFPEGRSGFQVLRDDLEVLLLSEAEGAGAHVQRGANAISVCTAVG
jgi:halogenation protein CepH